MFGSQPFGSQNPFRGPSQASGGGTGTPTCRECGSDALTEQDGVYVCAVCGLQSQDLFVEETEWQAGVNTTDNRHLRSRYKRRAKTAAPEQAGPREIAITYAECLQRHLMALCNALAVAHKLPQQTLSTIALHLWRTYLPLTDVFGVTGDKPRAGKAAGKNAAAAMDDEDDSGSDDSLSGDDSSSDSDSSSSDEPAAPGGAAGPTGKPARVAPPRSNRNLRTELHAHLPQLTPLAVAFLAAHWLRAPVVHTDLVRGCLDGTLPWLGFHAGLPRELTSKCPYGSLGVTTVPAPRVLLVAAAAIAHVIRLDCPPVNAAALAARFSRELVLPSDVGVAAGRLLLLHEPLGLWLGAPPGTAGQTHIAGDVTPATHIMAAVLFVLKARYRLGDQPAVRTAQPALALAPASAPAQLPEHEAEPSGSESSGSDVAQWLREAGAGVVEMDDDPSADDDDLDEEDAEVEEQPAGGEAQAPPPAPKLTRCGIRCKNGCNRAMCPCFRAHEVCTTKCSCTGCQNCGPEGKKPRKRRQGVRKPRGKRAPKAIVAVPQAMPIVLAGGHTDASLANGGGAVVDDVSGWQAWARVRALRESQRLPPGWLPRVAASLDEIVVSPGAVATYVNFLRGHVYAGRSAPRGLDDMLRILESMATPALSAPAEAIVPESAWHPRARDEAEQVEWVCKPWANIGDGGPAYGDVLAACAAHIWVPPLALHKTLLDLERRIIAAEAAAGLELGLVTPQ